MHACMADAQIKIKSLLCVRARGLGSGKLNGRRHTLISFSIRGIGGVRCPSAMGLMCEHLLASCWYQELIIRALHFFVTLF